MREGSGRPSLDGSRAMVTMRSRNKTNILQPDAPCLCGSGKAIVDCHLDPVDGRFRKHLPPLSPPGTPAGFAHPGCYLRDTCDCLEKISREHYMSKGMLEQLDTVLRVLGMPWLKTGQTLDTSVASLTAKILCHDTMKHYRHWTWRRRISFRFCAMP